MVVRTFRCRGYYTRSDRRAGGRPFRRCFPHLLSSGRWPPPPGWRPVGKATRNRWSPDSPDGTSPSRTSALRICETTGVTHTYDRTKKNNTFGSSGEILRDHCDRKHVIFIFFRRATRESAARLENSNGAGGGGRENNFRP